MGYTTLYINHQASQNNSHTQLDGHGVHAPVVTNTKTENCIGNRR